MGSSNTRKWWANSYKASLWSLEGFYEEIKFCRDLKFNKKKYQTEERGLVRAWLIPYLRDVEDVTLSQMHCWR